MERRLTVEFGPSRARRFAKVVAAARNGPGECSEIEPGRFRTTFVLGRDTAVYKRLAWFLESVRHWRASEAFDEHGPVSPYHAKEMAWCASEQLTWFGDCRFRFYFGVPPRCGLCPLLDARRAVQDALGEGTPAGLVFEIKLGPNWQALRRGEVQPASDQLDPNWIAPDFPPAEWTPPPQERD